MKHKNIFVACDTSNLSEIKKIIKQLGYMFIPIAIQSVQAGGLIKQKKINAIVDS